MAATAYPLTDEVAAEIVADIERGAFPHVAAEAQGIPADVFNAWMDRGDKKHARPAHRRFAAQVRAAIARARIEVEARVMKKAPLAWLKNGPGRDIPGSPGWAREPKAVPPPAGGNTFNFLSPEWSGLWSRVMAALAEFPEARAALAQALRQTEALQKALPPPVVTAQPAEELTSYRAH